MFYIGKHKIKTIKSEKYTLIFPNNKNIKYKNTQFYNWEIY